MEFYSQVKQGNEECDDMEDTQVGLNVITKKINFTYNMDVLLYM